MPELTMSKIICPYHKEDTPSMHLYYDTGTYKCFGCGKYGRFQDIGLPQTEPEPQEVADLEADIKRITALPVQEIRGLTLPTDGESYYIVWPDQAYYLRRAITQPENGPKYVGPHGHPRPLFEPNASSARHSLIICEGEINALSLAKAQDRPVVSPGSAGNFYARSKLKYLPIYAQYDKIMILADADKAGAIAAIELKSLLIQIGKNPVISLWAEDPNEMLVKYGSEAVKDKVEATFQALK